MPHRTFILLLVCFAVWFAWPVRGQPLPSGVTLANGLHAISLRELERLPDPVPIHRVLTVPGASLPIAPEGDPFRRMSREEFERLVRLAARNGAATPKLVQATYRAALDTDALTGTGEWLFTTVADGALALEPLRISLRDVKWSDGRKVRIYGSPARLWVEPRGRSPVTFAWSALGVEEPGAIRFMLGVPSSPIAILELELPADRVPVARAPTLIDGPVAKPGNRALWRIVFGGESSLEFTVRNRSAGRPATLANVGRMMRWDLSPGLAGLSCDFEFAPLRDAASQLEFLIEEGLTITDAAAAGLEDWQVRENRLTLRFREPFAGGKVAIAAVAPLPAGGMPWTAPGVHAVANPPTVDQMEILVNPELRLEGIDPGDFRPIRASQGERGYTLTFRGILPAEGAPQRRRPTLRLQGSPAEFSTNETLDWRIEARQILLTARIRALVARGPLVRLIVHIPAGATPVATVVAPDDPTATFTPLGNNLWAIEPTQPVPTGESLDVRLSIRDAAPAFDGTTNRTHRSILHPSPVGAIRREGTVTVQLAPEFRGWFSHPAVASLDSGSASYRFNRNPDASLTLALRSASVPEPVHAATRPEVAREWRFSDLNAAAKVDPDGWARVEFTGRIRAATHRELAMTLPPRAVFQSARIDGKWSDPQRSGETIQLPVPEPDADGTAFTVSYRLPTRSTGLRSLGDFRPELPGSPSIRVWVETGSHFRSWPRLAETAEIDSALIPMHWIRAAGFALAAILLGLLVTPYASGAHGRWIVPLFWFLSAMLGTAVWIAPVGWQLVLAPPLVVALLGVFSLSLRRRTIRAAIATAAFATAAFAPLGTGVAQAPAAVTVYFLAESPGDPNRLVALVPESLVARLTALAAPHLPAVFLTDAVYSGEEVEGQARLEGIWSIDVTREGVHEFELPLSGVKLESMTLDGAAAYPDATKPNRYRIAISGVGPHLLKAGFAVPTVVVAGDREAKFSVPDLPSSRITLVLPSDGRLPNFVGRIGGQRIQRESSRSRVSADLGPGGTVVIRWRDTDATAATVSVQEATVWSVNETRVEAVSTYLHRVERGAVSRLVFELPPGLEPGPIAVRELDTSGSTNGLKDWQLQASSGGSRLTLVLRQPARGRIATTIRYVSRTGPDNRPVLAMPRSTTGEPTASYLGVRFAGVVAESWQIENLIDIPTDVVAREFAAIPDFDFDRTLARSLRREGSKPPLARPTLRVAPIPMPATNELVWSLGLQADIAGTAQWSGNPISYVEFDAPAGVTIRDVSNENLAGWERAGSRVRAWFKSEVRDPTLVWSGQWPAYAPSTPLELPTVPGSIVRVRPMEDAAVEVSGGRAGQFQPSLRPRERVYRADPATAAPKFRVDLPDPLSVRQSEWLERTGSGFDYRITFDVPLASRRPHVLALVIRNLPSGVEPRFEWPADTTAVESSSEAGRRRWIAEFAPRDEKTLRIGVTIRIPKRDGAELPDAELHSGNVPLPRPMRRLVLPDDLRPGPGLATRERDGWRITTDAPVRLVDVQTPSASVPAPQPEDATPTETIRSTDSRNVLPGIIWLAGFVLISVIARFGSPGWGPEVLVGFGILAALAGGWVFAAVGIAGLLIRLVRLVRAIGRRTMR